MIIPGGEWARNDSVPVHSQQSTLFKQFYMIIRPSLKGGASTEEFSVVRRRCHSLKCSSLKISWNRLK